MDGQTDRWTTTMPIARPLLKYGPQTNHSQSHINYISSRPTQYRSFWGWPFRQNAQTHNSGTLSLTFTIKKQKHKT